MVQINFAQKQVNAKVVYYGPGMSGKTTNLEIVHQRAPEPNRGELTSISTDGDRTLFFDFMPLDLGTVAGMRTCFQIYTVPGQVYYNSTRKLVLQGVDGVVFVADSSASMQEENLESLKNLEENLAEYGKSIDELPITIQYNKRDLPDAMTVEDLNARLNPRNWPYFEAVANSGKGVFPTLKALAAQVLDSIHRSYGAGGSSAAGSQPAQAVAAAAAPQRQVGAPAAAMGPGTGFFPAPEVNPAAGAPQPAAAAAQNPAMPAPPPAVAEGQAPAVDAMARTTIHPPPGAQPGDPSMAGMPAPPAPNVPQQQPADAGLRMAGAPAPPQAPVPQAVSMQPATAPQPGMVGTAMTDSQFQPQQNAAPTMQPAQMMGVEASASAPAAASAPRSFPNTGTPKRAQEAPRFKPRSTTQKPPAKRRNALLTGVFVVGALAVGALLGSFVLSII